jgi:hypothetical protein
LVLKARLVSDDCVAIQFKTLTYKKAHSSKRIDDSLEAGRLGSLEAIRLIVRPPGFTASWLPSLKL